MAVLIVDEGHEVLNFDNWTTFVVLNDCVKPLVFLIAFSEERLDHLVVKEFFLSYTKDLECLLFCYKAASNS